MKKIEMYSFYDKKSERFDTPFFCFDEIHAKRNMYMHVQKEDTLMHTFKDDYEMFKLAEFDTVTGEVTVCKKSIMEGKEIQIRRDGE